MGFSKNVIGPLKLKMMEIRRLENREIAVSQRNEFSTEQHIWNSTTAI